MALPLMGGFIMGLNLWVVGYGGHNLIARAARTRPLCRLRADAYKLCRRGTQGRSLKRFGVRCCGTLSFVWGVRPFCLPTHVPSRILRPMGRLVPKQAESTVVSVRGQAPC